MYKKNNYLNEERFKYFLLKVLFAYTSKAITQLLP